MHWCGHCQEHYPEKHHGLDGYHKAGARYGPMGKGLAAVIVLERAGLEIPYDMEPVDRDSCPDTGPGVG